jgi:hypothetical protein
MIGNPVECHREGKRHKQAGKGDREQIPLAQCFTRRLRLRRRNRKGD